MDMIALITWDAGHIDAEFSSAALSNELTDLFALSKVSSYGGFLTYQSKSFGIPSEGMTLMDRRPDVLLTVRSAKKSLQFSGRDSLFIHLIISPQGQNMTLIHMAPQVPLPDRLYQGRVQLLEVST